MYVVNCCVSCRSGTRSPTCFNNGRSPLLHRRDELTLQPRLIINGASHRSTVYLSMHQIWILSSRMVTPNSHTIYLSGSHPQLGRCLRQRPVVIQTHHGRKTLIRNIRRIVHSDQTVGVRRVTHHQHPQIIVGMVVQSLALCGENSTVRF